MNADRIVRAYYGDPNHPSTQRCRRRVHWMCEQATGRRILDIGCSGGIVGLILAREGFEYTGIDIEDEALAFARDEAAKESAIVRERLRFQTADATALPFEDQTFDTVIVGEVLEHLIHPQRVLMEARRVLTADGRLVVTVPLGLTHDHVDHKRVFYPSSLVRLTRPYFDTLSVTVEDTYIRYIGTRRSREAAVSAPQDDDPLLRQLEEHCLSVEVERGRARTFLRNLKADLRAARLRAAAIPELEARLQDLELEAEARRAALARAERTAERLDAALREREQQHLAAIRELDAGYKKRLQDQEKKLQQLERLQQQEKQLQALAAKLDEQQKQLQAREQALRTREKRVSRDQEQDAAAERIRQFAAAACPRGARILVVSKGDERLVTLRGQAGLHFPQDADGTYAGFHPLDSAWAIAHLETLIRSGAEYLLLPAAAFWWLTYYAGFRDHLTATATPVAYDPEVGLLLRLSREPRAGEQPLPADTIARAAAAFGSGQVQATGTVTPATGPGSPGAPAPVSTPPAPAATTPPAAPANPSAPSLSIAPPSGNGHAGSSASAAAVNANGTAAAPAAPAIHKPSMVSATAVSEPPAHNGASPITVAAILDRFTASCLRPEARLVTFRPDNWRETLEAHPPDVVFVESAWQGNDGAWKYRIASYPTNMGDELLDLVRWAKDRGIPTVFWNKEDPVHFDRFLARSSVFDYVFTTDARCIPKYRAHFGHDRVYALPFAAQPALHNPVQTEPRTGMVCFAGTYYGSRHDERRRDLAHILLPAMEYGLDIYDRQAGIPSNDRDSYSFPEIYQPAIRGRLEYDEMVRAYKRYRVFLNVNSVKDSPTMFSRRVFELLACGTPVVSSYARGIVELLGDAVFISESEEDTRRHLEALLNGGEWARASLRGIRRVLGEHTYRRRLATVWETIGLRRAELAPPSIAVLVPLQTGQDCRPLAAAIRAQTQRPHEVVLLAPDGAPAPSPEWWRAQLPGIPVRATSTSGDPWQEVIGSSGAHAVAVMDPRDHYGPDYLRDHALALEYAPNDFLGKQSFRRREGQTRVVSVTPGSEFHPVRSVPAATLVVRRQAFTPEVLQAVRTGRIFSRPSDDILSIDAFNYVQNAHVAYGSAAPMESRMLALVEA